LGGKGKFKQSQGQPDRHRPFLYDQKMGAGFAGAPPEIPGAWKKTTLGGRREIGVWRGGRKKWRVTILVWQHSGAGRVKSGPSLQASAPVRSKTTQFVGRQIFSALGKKLDYVLAGAGRRGGLWSRGPGGGGAPPSFSGGADVLWGPAQPRFWGPPAWGGQGPI